MAPPASRRTFTSRTAGSLRKSLQGSLRWNSITEQKRQPMRDICDSCSGSYQISWCCVVTKFIRLRSPFPITFSGWWPKYSSILAWWSVRLTAGLSPISFMLPAVSIEYTVFRLFPSDSDAFLNGILLFFDTFLHNILTPLQHLFSLTEFLLTVLLGLLCGVEQLRLVLPFSLFFVIWRV